MKKFIPRRATNIILTVIPSICLLAGCATTKSSPADTYASMVTTPAYEAAPTPDISAAATQTFDTEPASTDANSQYADLEAISNFRTSDLTDAVTLGNLIDPLPAITDVNAGQFIQNRFTVQTDISPFRVILFYEPCGVDDNLNIDTNFSLSKAENNAAILMAYVDNLEKVTLRFRPQSSFDQVDFPLSTEWSKYPESVSFTREQLSEEFFNGEDFKTLGDNITLFNQLLVENENRNEAGSVQFMPGPDCYNLDNQYLAYMPQLWMDNVVIRELGNTEQSLDGLMDSYIMEVQPKYFNYVDGTIAWLYLFQDDAWRREYEDNPGYIELGDFDGIVFALQFTDTDIGNMQDNALTDLYSQLRTEAGQPDFQAACKIKKLSRP